MVNEIWPLPACLYVKCVILAIKIAINHNIIFHSNTPSIISAITGTEDNAESSFYEARAGLGMVITPCQQKTNAFSHYYNRHSNHCLCTRSVAISGSVFVYPCFK